MEQGRRLQSGTESRGGKSNEITAIPELLDKIGIKGQIVTIDAMGTQTAIAEKIKEKREDYVLALKGNQGMLYEDVKEYFGGCEFLRKIKEKGNYKKTQEKAHSCVCPAKTRYCLAINTSFMVR